MESVRGRHGGMTELEEAELTDGQGRALSTHKTQQSYEGYAKRTAKRMLSATKKRHAHRMANEQATSVQNAALHPFRMKKEASQKALNAEWVRWLGREDSNLRMPESKSPDRATSINGNSELSRCVPALKSLEEFSGSECEAKRFREATRPANARPGQGGNLEPGAPA